MIESDEMDGITFTPILSLDKLYLDFCHFIKGSKLKGETKANFIQQLLLLTKQAEVIDIGGIPYVTGVRLTKTNPPEEA
jgi:hypothetical protein